jgi:LysM repeat protein
LLLFASEWLARKENKVAQRIVIAVMLLIGVGFLATPAVGAAAEQTTYTVQPGDTLWGISVSYGFSSWETLYEANKSRIANPQSLVIGTVLVIPGGGEEAVNPPAPAIPAPASNGYSGIESIIADAAYRYGQSPSAMMAVAWCESRYDPSAYNPLSAASGLFQFLPSTWASTPYAGYSPFNAYASANAAGWMWQQGRRGEWVC